MTSAGTPARASSLGLREAQGPGRGPDRYEIGLHHVAFGARSRKLVDRCASWLGGQDIQIESGPKEYDYTPGYYAVFFYDPDGLKLEVLHRSRIRAAIGR